MNDATKETVAAMAVAVMAVAFAFVVAVEEPKEPTPLVAQPSELASTSEMVRFDTNKLVHQLGGRCQQLDEKARELDRNANESAVRTKAKKLTATASRNRTPLTDLDGDSRKPAPFPSGGPLAVGVAAASASSNVEAPSDIAADESTNDSTDIAKKRQT
jgi:hypothetical protein